MTLPVLGLDVAHLAMTIAGAQVSFAMDDRRLWQLHVMELLRPILRREGLPSLSIEA